MSELNEEQQVREYLSKFLEEGENLVGFTRGREGNVSMIIIGCLIGVLSRMFGEILFVSLTDKRLLVVRQNGNLYRNYELAALQSITYSRGLSWLSHFYPAWIVVQGNDGAKSYILVYGKWRDNAKAIMGAVS